MHPLCVHKICGATVAAVILWAGGVTMEAVAKKRSYYQKLYDEAPMVRCACGCGALIKSMDKYGRKKRFISGHNGRKYQDKGQYKREWNHRNRAKRRQYKLEYGRSRKIRLIKLLGGSCEKCDLKYGGTNGAVFDFHHRDPSEKLFALNAAKLVTYAWERIEEEAKKCDLICSNCHRVEHFGGW